MSFNEFFTNLGQAVLGIGGAILTVILPLIYSLIKKFLLQKLAIVENQGEIQARELFSNFSKEAYNAVEQLNKQGILDTSKKDAFDKIFKENFPNASQELIDLYREAVVGKANANKLQVAEAVQPVNVNVNAEVNPDVAKQVTEHISKTAEAIQTTVQ